MKTQNFRDMINLMESSIGAPTPVVEEPGNRQAGEPVVKAYKIRAPSNADDRMIWIWAENQEVLTIEDMKLENGVLYVYPMWDDGYNEQDRENLDMSLSSFANDYYPEDYDDEGQYIGHEGGYDTEDREHTPESALNEQKVDLQPEKWYIYHKKHDTFNGPYEDISQATAIWNEYWREYDPGAHHTVIASGADLMKIHGFDQQGNLSSSLNEDDSVNLDDITKSLNDFIARVYPDASRYFVNVNNSLVLKAPTAELGRYIELALNKKLAEYGFTFDGFADLGQTSSGHQLEIKLSKKVDEVATELGEDEDQGGVLPDGTTVTIKTGNVCQGQTGKINGFDHIEADAGTEWSRYRIEFPDGGHVYKKQHQFDIVTDEPVVEAPQAPNLTSIAKQLNASLASLGLDFKVTGKNPQGLVMTAPNSDDGWIYDTLGNSFEMHCEDILYKAGLKFGGFTVRGGPETTVLIKFTEGVEAPMEQLGEDDGEPYDIRKDGFREEGIMYAIDEDGQTFRWLVGSYNKMVMLLGGNPNPDGVDIHVSTHEECADRMVPEDQYGKNNWWKFMGMLDDGNIIFLEEIDQLMQDGTPGAELGMQALISSGSTADVESVSRLGEATVDRNPNVPSTQKMGGNAPTMNGAEIKQNQSADLGQDIMAKDEDGNEYDASYIERLKQLAGVK